MAFTDMLEEFFTPRIDAALSQNDSRAGFTTWKCVFNADSSVVTLLVLLKIVIITNLFHFMQEKFLFLVVALVVSANIASVSTPAGMSYSCVLKDLGFGPNAWGYVT